MWTVEWQPGPFYPTSAIVSVTRRREVPMTPSQFEAWQAGEPLARVMPHLTDDQRAFLEELMAKSPNGPRQSAARPSPLQVNCVRLAEAIVADLFQNSAGDQAERLMLVDEAGRDLGSWGKVPVVDRIARTIEHALRGT